MNGKRNTWIFFTCTGISTATQRKVFHVHWAFKRGKKNRLMWVWTEDYVKGTNPMHFRRTFGCAIPMIHKELHSLWLPSSFYGGQSKFLINEAVWFHFYIKTPQIWQSYAHTQVSKTFSCYNTANVITPETNEKLLHNFPVIQSKERIVETARTGTVCLGRDSKPSEKNLNQIKTNKTPLRSLQKPSAGFTTLFLVVICPKLGHGDIMPVSIIN